MVREIMKDEAFLAEASEKATAEDMDTARDLLETLEAHKAGCVGMAANMIGVRRRIIAFDNEGSYMVMFNPEIVKKSVSLSKKSFRQAAGLLSTSKKCSKVV